MLDLLWNVVHVLYFLTLAFQIALTFGAVATRESSYGGYDRLVMISFVVGGFAGVLNIMIYQALHRLQRKEADGHVDQKFRRAALVYSLSCVLNLTVSGVEFRMSPELLRFAQSLKGQDGADIARPLLYGACIDAGAAGVLALATIAVDILRLCLRDLPERNRFIRGMQEDLVLDDNLEEYHDDPDTGR